jgi:hypothetical protein
MADEAPPNVRPQDLNAASQARAPRPLRLPQGLGRRPARFEPFLVRLSVPGLKRSFRSGLGSAAARHGTTGPDR